MGLSDYKDKPMTMEYTSRLRLNREMMMRRPFNTNPHKTSQGGSAKPVRNSNLLE